MEQVWDQISLFVKEVWRGEGGYPKAAKKDMATYIWRNDSQLIKSRSLQNDEFGIQSHEHRYGGKREEDTGNNHHRISGRVGTSHDVWTKYTIEEMDGVLHAENKRKFRKI